MSQHKLRTLVNGHELSVLAGWDNQLQSFFMTIKDFHTEEVIYSDMEDGKISVFQGPTDFGYFIEKAKENGVILPEAMIEHIKLDQQVQPINRFALWNSSGKRLADTHKAQFDEINL